MVLPVSLIIDLKSKYKRNGQLWICIKCKMKKLSTHSQTHKGVGLE